MKRLPPRTSTDYPTSHFTCGSYVNESMNWENRGNETHTILLLTWPHLLWARAQWKESLFVHRQEKKESKLRNSHYCLCDKAKKKPLPCPVAISANCECAFGWIIYLSRGCLVRRTKVPSANASNNRLRYAFSICSRLHLVADHFHLTSSTVGFVYYYYYPSTNCLIGRAHIAQSNVVITQSLNVILGAKTRCRSTLVKPVKRQIFRLARRATAQLQNICETSDLSIPFERELLKQASVLLHIFERPTSKRSSSIWPFKN